MIEDLSAGDLSALLAGGFGTPLEIHESIDSTNRRALEWAAEGVPHGATVVADVQTAGRGRHGRTWSAMPGTSLLFSVVVRPAGSVALDLLPVAAGVAVARALEDIGVIDVSLKWPNDVLIEGAKVCGILVESRYESARPLFAVVGIGINVAGSSSELSARIGRTVTALVPDHAESVSRGALLARSLNHLARVWADLEGGTTSPVVAEANDRSWIAGREVVLLLADGSTAEAVARRVLEDGALEVADGDRIWTVVSGEIERVQPSRAKP